MLTSTNGQKSAAVQAPILRSLGVAGSDNSREQIVLHMLSFQMAGVGAR
jgi:hypothetical protein